MSIRLRIGLMAIAGCTLVFAEEKPGLVEFHESRPLGKLVGQLWKSKFLITYEEAPYDESTELFTDTYANGTRFRYPAWKPITFHIPQAAHDGPRVAGAQGRAAPTAESVAESAVAEYNASGNPGRFRVVRDCDYVHLVSMNVRKGQVRCWK